jgi:hypothetical protein
VVLFSEEALLWFLITDLAVLVESEIDWDILSRQLSVADQDKHRPTISLLDRNEPKYFWITKNIDFTQWESDENSQALWLSGPHNRGMKEVSSHIIRTTNENANQSNSSVLYFFCSTATMARGSIAAVFAHTLLRQIVCSSGAGKATSIAVTFLKSLLGEHIQQQRLSRFEENDTLSMTAEKILDVPDSELGRALVEAMRTAEIQKLSIIVDGIDITTQGGEVFVQNIYFLVMYMVTNTKFKVVLTNIQNPDLQNTFGRLPCTCIEYDKERKGLRFRHSLAYIIAN